MDKQTALRNLRLHQAWLEKRPKRTPENINKAVNIMVGAFQVLASCGVTAEAWCSRRTERRRVLRNIRERYSEPDGRRVLRQLLETTITALEAATWIKSLPAGALPTPKEPKAMTEAQRAQLKAAREKARRTRAAGKRRQEEAREARLQKTGV